MFLSNRASPFSEDFPISADVTSQVKTLNTNYSKLVILKFCKMYAI